MKFEKQVVSGFKQKRGCYTSWKHWFAGSQKLWLSHPWQCSGQVGQDLEQHGLVEDLPMAGGEM